MISSVLCVAQTPIVCAMSCILLIVSYSYRGGYLLVLTVQLYKLLQYNADAKSETKCRDYSCSGRACAPPG